MLTAPAITAVDTNVLLDLFQSDERFAAQSLDWLRTARQNGEVIVCDIVYAELAGNFRNRNELDAALRELGAAVSPINAGIAYLAGRRWAEYRRRGGPRSRRILPDFLIGAHAALSARTFLTRDNGFFTAYFPELGG